MNDSRNRILHYLKQHGQATVAELAHELDLTTVTIRHHLQVMQDAGLVGKPRQKPRLGPGRPEMTYYLTARASDYLPRNYGPLTQSILRALAENLPTSQLANLFTLAGKTLAEEAALKQSAGMNQRIKHLKDWLESNGYFLSWEKGERELFLHFAHCPYLEVAKEHKAVCNFDQAFIGRMLETPVTLSKRIALGDLHCTLLAILPDAN
jgi:DeoR family suf operon transcriptional repressor